MGVCHISRAAMRARNMETPMTGPRQANTGLQIPTIELAISNQQLAINEHHLKYASSNTTTSVSPTPLTKYSNFIFFSRFFASIEFVAE